VDDSLLLAESPQPRSEAPFMPTIVDFPALGLRLMCNYRAGFGILG
jgi:hypothetical protein